MKRRTLIEKIDILQSATALIEEFGEHAPFHATRRAGALLENGDLDGQQTWLAVHRAITKLLQAKTRVKELIH
jgi:hypothetical protein